ncbi:MULTISPECIES: Lrp/AsnC family transcriptional regulator [Thalassospira]|uniref:ArsR family transcriptional regulator n=1 Tax=Thalassospira profundimaris TaxID=502049 RepID=A0A367X9W5_9PROT|nr:Lrp/AsnC family transcriptional regulator [Thalassospira profundimaris]RCK49472.1 ArsR family transcriptional regulator [Thalassospira profundimaris]
MTDVVLNATDIRILQALQKDAGISNVQLAELVGMSPSPCLRRVKQLEASGIIKGQVALVDRKKLGFGVLATIQVRLQSHTEAGAEDFARAMNDLPEVLSCWAMTGRQDFLLVAVARDIESFGDFVTHKLLSMPNVRDVQSSLVLKEYKNHTAIPMPKVP